MVRLPIAAGLVLLLSACVPPPTPAPPPPPAAAPAPTPTPTPQPPPPVSGHGDLMDARPEPGDWRYRSSDAQTVAEFADRSGQPRVRLTCTGDRTVVLAVANRHAGVATMLVRTETLERQVALIGNGNWVETRLPARDPLLDAIAFSRGRFGLEIEGGDALYLAPYPELTRVIEDCR